MSARPVLAVLVFLLSAPASAEAQSFAGERLAMVQVIILSTILSSLETEIEALDPDVLKVMAKVPRHEFVPEPLASLAYGNGPLPLGHGQNISQPFINALMTHLMAPKPGDTVYETGTGAGYQAALLQELGARVYSVEIVEPLAAAAAERLHRLGYTEVYIKTGDGYDGWPEHGPYDAILVKEALDHVPQPLLDQLRPGGRMVLPLGSGQDVQHLTVITKGDAGEVTINRVMPVRFAPFQGGERI